MNLFVRDELRRYTEERTERPTVPSPAVTMSFEKGSFTPFAEVKLTESCGFVPYREGRARWGEGLMSTNVGDRVSFTFTGSTAAFLYRKGDRTDGMGRVKVIVDGAELPERPRGYAKGLSWWFTPPFWLCRGKAGTHTVEIETLPPEKPGDPVGFRLAALLVSP